MLKHIYIYALCDPTGTIFYIGQSDNPDARLRAHQSAVVQAHRYKRTYTPVMKAIALWAEQKQAVTMRIFLRTSDRSLASRMERMLIANCDEILANTLYCPKERQMFPELAMYNFDYTEALDVIRRRAQRFQLDDPACMRALGVTYEYIEDINRIKNIIAMRKNGQTLQAIGNEFNVTRERIRQILKEQ